MACLRFHGSEPEDFTPGRRAPEALPPHQIEDTRKIAHLYWTLILRVVCTSSHFIFLVPKEGGAGLGVPKTNLSFDINFFFNEFIYLFIYLWLRWVFVAACVLSLVVASGGYTSLRRVGFSLWWLPSLRSTGSRCAGFSSCGTWAQQLWLAGSRAQAQ